ncbi:MAG: hypothetical protein IPP96_03595 [Chitinophagaceae bacterium]|nr:hypothetical protein [Chitinophagaceae bacterium]
MKKFMCHLQPQNSSGIIADLSWKCHHVKIRSKTVTFYFAMTEALMMIKTLHDECHAFIEKNNFNTVLSKKINQP